MAIKKCVKLIKKKIFFLMSQKKEIIRKKLSLNPRKITPEKGVLSLKSRLFQD